MSFSKKHALLLSILMIAPVQQSNTAQGGDVKGGIFPASMALPNLDSLSNKVPSYSFKDLSKLTAFLCVCPTLGYYFFHCPEDRRSQAPIENIFRGNWNNVTEDLFNWDNVTHFGDIIPGQRWKVYPYTLCPKESDEKEIKIPVTNLQDIKGFGLYHFCEKNLNKILKYCAATGAAYAILYGKIPMTLQSMLELAFNPRAVGPRNV